VLGELGVLIAGAAGSGKSGLALALVSHMRAFGKFGRLVADDQLFLSQHAGRLFCTAPDSIAGLVEIRGIGPRPVAYEAKAQVDLLVRLVDRDVAPRFAEMEMETLADCQVPCMTLAAADRQAALFAIISQLFLPPFG
jgi:serine kinase of HPr protein (carbohydrate metabolism regulator)